MKSVIVSLAFILSGLALANPKPLIVKNSGGGFVMPEYAGFERCEVYTDKVIISQQFGHSTPTSLKLSEVRKISIAGDIALVIENAKEEKVTETPNGMCDGPSNVITAYDKEGKEVELYSNGGCGTPGKSRDGALSRKLKAIVNRYCPNKF